MEVAISILMGGEPVSPHECAASGYAAYNYLKLRCPECGNPVFIAALESEHMQPHFRHFKGVDPEECEIRAKGYTEAKLESFKSKARSQRLAIYLSHLESMLTVRPKPGSAINLDGEKSFAAGRLSADAAQQIAKLKSKNKNARNVFDSLVEISLKGVKRLRPNIRTFTEAILENVVRDAAFSDMEEILVLSKSVYGGDFNEGDADKTLRDIVELQSTIQFRLQTQISAEVMDFLFSKQGQGILLKLIESMVLAYIKFGSAQEILHEGFAITGMKAFPQFRFGKEANSDDKKIEKFFVRWVLLHLAAYVSSNDWKRNLETVDNPVGHPGQYPIVSLPAIEDKADWAKLKL